VSDFTSFDLALKLLPDPVAQQKLNDFNNNISKINWSTISAQSISDIKNEDHVGQPVKIIATMSSLSDSTPYELPDGTRITIINVKLQDRQLNEIHCLDILYDDYKDVINTYQNKGCFLIFCGTVLSLIYQVGGEYVFYIHDIQERISAEDLIGIRPDPKNKVAKIFMREAQKKSGIVNYIKRRLVKNLGIKGLNSAKELDKCIDFMILQSFSEGMDEKNSMKLHSLAIGAPNVGKKLLTLIARILNPVSEEVACTDGKITPAGIVGDVKWSNGRRISNPGYLPRASGGVLCIQDFHAISQARKKVLASFAQVMEDGLAIDSSVARWEHEALTSIHLDMNRYSQINPAGTYDANADIDIPTNILSRFDFIMDIPADLKRQTQVAYDISTGEKIISSLNRRIVENKWERELKRMVAYLRTYFFKVKISNDINAYIREKIKSIAENNKNSSALSDTITRLAVSVQKYVKAIASSKHSFKASRQDVDRAFKFIEEKLKFLSTFDHVSVPKTLSQKKPTIQGRQVMLREQYKGKEVSVDEVKAYLNEETGFAYADKTIIRDLEQIGRKVKMKTYRIVNG
jgi:sulfur relay (sulfurtransferase) DsrC/TusE family protein